MILVDTNLLLYAGVDKAPFHQQANKWLTEQFSAGIRIGLPWHSVLGFVRLASNRKVYPGGPSVEDAWGLAQIWLRARNAWIPQPTDRHTDVISELIASGDVGSKAVMDIHLAALAIEHGLTLCSVDVGFFRYKKLRWINPLDP
jgi:toxin-antitoxin system PIN domain toxin